MVREYAGEGTLRTFMNRFEDKKLPESFIRDFTRMLLQGLATTHAHGYVHCNLKPENILVFSRHVYKNNKWRWCYELNIYNFWLMKKDGDSSWWKTHSPFAGTPMYMSPESISHGETGKGLDLWSLGCVVLEMYTGKRPWWHKNYDLEDLKNYNEPLIPSEIPDDAKDFIRTCFVRKADERKDALTLLKFRFITERIDEDLNITEHSRPPRHNLDHVPLAAKLFGFVMGTLFLISVYLSTP